MKNLSTTFIRSLAILYEAKKAYTDQDYKKAHKKLTDLKGDIDYMVVELHLEVKDKS